MKKGLSFLFVLVFVLSIAQFNVFADASSDFTIQDGVLTKYNGAGGAVVIPDGITTIGDKAFGMCKSLTSVIIPDGIVSIGNDAFAGCTKLTSINIPNSIKTIGIEAFAACTSLTSITIPSSIKSISNNTFTGCTSLVSITIPSSVKTIGGYALSQCPKLTIYGEADSYAQTYAKTNNIPFKSIDGNTATTPVSSGNQNINSIKASNITRLSGDNRYKTAVAISQSGWAQSDNVILVDGNNYPDALVGTSYAYLKNAPILTTPSDKLDSNISAEIARLGAKTVYILGNKTSVSQSVEDELSQKYTVVRIAGTGIFDTAVKVGEEIRKTNKFDTVALAAQGGFADALAIAPFSAKNTMPILFSGQDSLRPDTLQALKDWGIKNVVIVGGTGVISSAVEDTLKGMGITVTRLAGQDRYETALEIIKHFAPSEGYKSISVCTGENYADALTGAVLAAKNNIPLVLVSKDSAKDNITLYINKNTIDKAYIFGGTGVVSDKVVSN